jgi:hypothetical protein
VLHTSTNMGITKLTLQYAVDYYEYIHKKFKSFSTKSSGITYSRCSNLEIYNKI